MTCQLCDALTITRRYYEDELCWIADCLVCKVPMVVLREHTRAPSEHLRKRLAFNLGRVADRIFGLDGWQLDDAMRRIPDHYHAHARRIASRRPARRSASELPTPPLRVLSRPAAFLNALRGSGEGCRGVVSIVDPGKQPPFLHDRHLVLSCVDAHPLADAPGAAKHLPPGAAGRREIEAVVRFAEELGPDPWVMVHCEMGVSRSPAAAIAMLMVWGWTFYDAYDALAGARHPSKEFRPNALMVRAIEDVFGIELDDAYAARWTWGERNPIEPHFYRVLPYLYPALSAESPFGPSWISWLDEADAPSRDLRELISQPLPSSVNMAALRAVVAFLWYFDGVAALAPDDWRAIFKSIGFVNLGRTASDSRPTEDVVLYRGSPPDQVRGMSWTTNSKKAFWFAALRGASEGVVARALVSPGDLLGVLQNEVLGSTSLWGYEGDEYVLDPVVLAELPIEKFGVTEASFLSPIDKLVADPTWLEQQQRAGRLA